MECRNWKTKADCASKDCFWHEVDDTCQGGCNRMEGVFLIGQHVRSVNLHLPNVPTQKSWEQYFGELPPLSTLEPMTTTDEIEFSNINQTDHEMNKNSTSEDKEVICLR